MNRVQKSGYGESFSWDPLPPIPYWTLNSSIWRQGPMSLGIVGSLGHEEGGDRVIFGSYKL